VTHPFAVGVLLADAKGSLPAQAFATLFEEATFYDRQWAATWEGQNRPSENQ
jgi:hypothetical protein